MKSRCTGYGCGKPIDMRASRKTTLCRSCNNAQIARSPHRRAAAAAQMKALHADPVRSKARTEKAAASFRARWESDPEFRERFRKARMDPKRRLSPGMKLLPPEYHEMYVALGKYHYDAQQRLAMVQEQVRADRRKAGHNDL